MEYKDKLLYKEKRFVWLIFLEVEVQDRVAQSLERG
jgi:hypothetical protein